MKKILTVLKILFLTVITFGIYGAYWITVNLFNDANDPEINETEKNSREAQNIVTATVLHFLNR